MEESRAVILAPAVSFLSNEEAEWIRFVNLQAWWDREAESDYFEATGHMVDLLHQYLNALSTDPAERGRVFKEIAGEISNQLKAVDQFLVPNPHFSPGADWTDQTQVIEAKPFLFANIEGVAGMYASLGRFLASVFVRRLDRCRLCHGLFIAPDDGGYGCCPNMDCWPDPDHPNAS